MADKDSGEDPVQRTMIVVLTLVFVTLYVGAMMEWDNLAMKVSLIQPIVYVIIGYFFGRMPSEKNEKALREDAKEKGEKADAAKGDAARATSKLGAVKRILSETGGDSTPTGVSAALNRAGTDPGVLQERVRSALKAIDE